jgi:hypothetical protein
MSKVFLMGFILLFFTSCSQNNIKPENHLVELVNDLSNEERCDEAYKKISKLGKEVIPFLLENSRNEKEYNGSIIYYLSSFVIAKPSVGVVSLFLVESILKKEQRPYVVPLIVNKIKDKFPYKNSNTLFPTTRKEYINEAVEYYKKWWEKVKDMDLEEIRKTSPLEGTELRWF